VRGQSPLRPKGAEERGEPRGDWKRKKKIRLMTTSTARARVRKDTPPGPEREKGSAFVLLQGRSFCHGKGYSGKKGLTCNKSKSPPGNSMTQNVPSRRKGERVSSNLEPCPKKLREFPGLQGNKGQGEVHRRGMR